MRKGDKLCILRDTSPDPQGSDTTKLVAALAALGIPLDPDCGYSETRELVDGNERRVITWALQAQSTCGRHDTRRMIAAWSDAAWLQAHPEHPLTYLKCGFGNLAMIQREMQTRAPLALIRRGKRIALIPFDATAPRCQELLQQLES